MKSDNMYRNNRGERIKLTNSKNRIILVYTKLISEMGPRPARPKVHQKVPVRPEALIRKNKLLGDAKKEDT